MFINAFDRKGDNCPATLIDDGSLLCVHPSRIEVEPRRQPDSSNLLDCAPTNILTLFLVLITHQFSTTITLLDPFVSARLAPA
jgi:hypothetical protein